MPAMDQELEPDHSRRRRSRRKRAPEAPELKVVGSDEAPAEANGQGQRPTARRSEGGRKKVTARRFGDIFRTQPIAGTSLSVREHSANESDAMLDDDADNELNDREFTVQAVQRQLVGDPAPSIEEVRDWSDQQLLAGARAMLSFPPLRVLINGVEQPPEPDEVVAVPDPLAFGSFREAVTARPKRIYSSLADTARRITELGLPKMASMIDTSAFEAIRAQAGTRGALSPGSALGSALESIRNSPALKMKLPELDFMKGTAAQLKSLTDTAAIADSLTKFQATTLAAERLAKPDDFGPLEPIRMPVIPPPYQPEVDAIESLGERIEAMAENQARADREQLEAMTAQAELTRDQGVAIQGVIAEVKGLRNDQRWPNRAVIIGAFLAGALLVIGIIAAIPVIMELLKP